MRKQSIAKTDHLCYNNNRQKKMMLLIEYAKRPGAGTPGRFYSVGEQVA